MKKILVCQCNGSQLIEEVEQISETSYIINEGKRQVKDSSQRESQCYIVMSVMPQIRLGRDEIIFLDIMGLPG
jgi:hypothetical protein